VKELPWLPEPIQRTQDEDDNYDAVTPFTLQLVVINAIVAVSLTLIIVTAGLGHVPLLVTAGHYILVDGHCMLVAVAGHLR